MKPIWKFTFGGLVCVLAVVLISSSAHAIPAFATKHKLSCTDCHAPFPKLNSFGRDFKTNGYRIMEEVAGNFQNNEEIADDLVLEKTFPLSALVKGYAYDQKKDSDAKTRGFHEIELMIGGMVFKNISFWAEIEAEDENDFAPGIEMGMVGFHLSPYANITIGYGPYFWNDPFDTLVDWGRRLTRAHKAPLDVTNKYASGVRLRSANQFISIYGKVSRFYYSIGYHRDTGDPEGEGGEDISARAAFELSPTLGNTNLNISIGGFGVFGLQGGKGDEGIDFSRYGVDLQAEIGENLNLLFVYLMAQDNLAPGVADKEKNNSLYGELFWIFRNKNMNPSFVPLIRIENYEREVGAQNFTDLVLNLGYYVSQNVKLNLEYWTNLSVPDGIDKTNRITGFFTVLF